MVSIAKLARVLDLVEDEILNAARKHRAFASPHEAFAVIDEEMNELWEEIRKVHSFDMRTIGMKQEAIQVAAMAVRFITDLIEV